MRMCLYTFSLFYVLASPHPLRRRGGRIGCFLIFLFAVYSPRHRCACLPSLLRKEGEDSYVLKPLLLERVGGRLLSVLVLLRQVEHPGYNSYRGGVVTVCR